MLSAKVSSLPRLLACGVVASSFLWGTPIRAQETSPKPGIVAVVNGKELTEPEFWRRCERMVGGGPDTAVGYLVLREWIQHTIAEEEAKRRNLLPTPQEVDRRAVALRKQFEMRGQNFDEWLAGHGRTVDTLRNDLRQQLIVENLLTEGIKVSDTEVALYYANNKAVLGVGEQLRVSRITVEQKEAAREVEAALKKGTAFEELAKKYSKDTFAANGGKVPTPVDADPKSQGPLEPEVMEKLAKLEAGKAVGPVKLDTYWVFARIDQRIPARAPDLLDVQELILANLKVQKGGPERLKAAQDRLNQLQREAKVEIHRPEYQRLLKLFRPKE